jgi:hypothetical protein
MFIKATKKQSKLRLAIMAPSGAGKTMTSLRIAKGLGGKVAVIDTERGSASKYSDRFEFDVCELEEYSINAYVKAIKFAQEAGYNILIIDSLTHAWQELLAEVEKIAQAQFRGNTWSAWSKGTPMQRKLIDTLLNFDGHIIATMRTKTEWVLETNSNGKSVPKKVGTSAEQGKGIEYEFDMLLEITVDHFATFTKDRSGQFQDRAIEKPDEKIGEEIGRWLGLGEVVTPKANTPEKTQESIIQDALDKISLSQTNEELTSIYRSLNEDLKKDALILDMCKNRKQQLTEGNHA